MSIFHLSLMVAISGLSLCLVLASIRFALGPSLPDRITAFDLFVANMIGIIAIYSELTGNEDFIDVAIILSLFGFLGSISFAYFLMKRTDRHG
ncbi:monovalent cation/H+ antiporter complex subunit F [Cesiribacter andamanensis]|uniref:Multiple resistance and pH homeostasis protein F n=1 Tax=Cesiribacter andamanensis AMV16 TaxID=1279009 RepID=M7MZJ4_9BACT|nr:monovalent cation/H+ antiporter complex subunit F [Cesiribacter andamanensis]EMR01843.1 Multiple resistance and pH homeostasis protein F [Cesiribacter andamanensis AMV16]